MSQEENLRKKILVIDQICNDIHPAEGVDKGWGTYTGGMTDTGSWFFRKMIDVPLDDLEEFYEERMAVQRRALKRPTKKISKEDRENRMMEFRSGIERKFILGT